MKRFLSITICVMLIFATVCCLTACKKDSVTPVYIRVVDPTGKDKYIYSGAFIKLPYTGDEIILEVEVVTVKGKAIKNGSPTVKCYDLSGNQTSLTQKGFYEIRISYNTSVEGEIFVNYSSAEATIRVDIE